jgi:hypothetical protein
VLLDAGPSVGLTSKFQSIASKGTATVFWPRPRKPPTPTSTPCARPSAPMSTSSTSPMLLMSEPITSVPLRFETRMAPGAWVMKFPCMVGPPA